MSPAKPMMPEIATAQAVIRGYSADQKRNGLACVNSKIVGVVRTQQKGIEGVCLCYEKRNAQQDGGGAYSQ